VQDATVDDAVDCLLTGKVNFDLLLLCV